MEVVIYVVGGILSFYYKLDIFIDVKLDINSVEVGYFFFY